MGDLEQENAGVIAPPPLIYAVALALGLLVQRAWPVGSLPRPISRLIGWPLLLSGIAGIVWGFVTMKQADTPVDPREPVRHLVTAGPFGLSRNPIYVSLTLIYLGIANVANALWPVFLLPAVLFVMQRGVIEREERYLARRFGAEYAQYKDRIRRWL